MSVGMSVCLAKLQHKKIILNLDKRPIKHKLLVTLGQTCSYILKAIICICYVWGIKDFITVHTYMHILSRHYIQSFNKVMMQTVAFEKLFIR